MTTLLLVEDHRSFGQALAAMAGLEPDLHVVARLERGEDVVDLPEDVEVDVAIVDLDLPGMGGVDTIVELRQRAPSLRCVVLTALTSDVELGRAVEAGASAVLHKSVEIEEVFGVVRAVAAGENRLDPAATSRWLGALARHREEQWRARVTADVLSPREHEVLRRLARGERTTEVAADLRISEATVQTHIRNLRAKLGVSSRLEAVVEAMRLGLVPPE